MNKKMQLRTIKILSLLLIIIFCSWQPINSLEEIQNKFDQFQQRYTAVKINMIFNQPVFSPGDTAFFNAWYTNEENISIKGNHIVNVDLLSGTGSTQQQMRFRIKDGSSSNQIIFNKNLQPGIYKLVAYTDWMKNFGESWYFQKTIQILQRNKLAVQESPDQSFQLYSEGGNFVNGLINKVVVIGTSSKELTIKNQQGSIIQKLTLDSTGLGSFMMKPEDGQAYFAEDVSLGKSFPLPKVETDGIAMQLDEKNKQVSLSIHEESKLKNQDIYLVCTAGGKITTKEKLSFSSDKLYYTATLIPKDGILNQIFILNSAGKVISQRIYFPTDAGQSIAVKMQFPSQVMQRSNVTGGITILDKSGNPVEAEASITIVQDNLFNEFDVANSYMLDLPELTDRIENYGKSKETINDFLITQTWKKINWDAIFSSTPIKLQYPFQTLATLKGQVTSNKTGSAPPDSTILLTYLQKNTIGYEAYVNGGKFEMPLIFDFWGGDYIFCSIQHNSKILDDDYTITLLKDSVSLKQRWNSTEKNESSPYGEYSFKKKLVSNSFNYFSVDQSKNLAENLNQNSLLEEEFMEVDYTVNVSEYLIFPKMEDLLREIVPYAQYRKKGNVESVRMFFVYKNSTKISKGDPLYIIDGLMSMSTSYFLSLKPEDILFIKILNNPNKLSQLGKLGANGVIFVESKKGNLAPASMVKNLFPIVGFNRSVDFSKKQIQSTSSALPRVPYLNSTIFWNPSVTVNSSTATSINFSTGDDLGPMRIIIRGVTKKGQPFSAEQLIDVSFNALKN